MTRGAGRRGAGRRGAGRRRAVDVSGTMLLWPVTWRTPVQRVGSRRRSFRLTCASARCRTGRVSAIRGASHRRPRGMRG
ncbi:predicted protein [Streptomyces viridochromogenes DSM 40736]|uniref:Predicted protein n=1 Tax=Streptomyces viridochromogenes (strain DSM 40736 / JCM 4977 / BCRC 1201 / Tue 494) TaxID=591159 RepID=D9XDN0_STRVT|nr:predicted protein [Streptomyces viridochromogenes DSM 40736]